MEEIAPACPHQTAPPRRKGILRNDTDRLVQQDGVVGLGIHPNGLSTPLDATPGA